MGLACLVVFFLPGQERLRQRGPMNTGHDSVACASCHTQAPGSIRQQIQANTRFILGLRKTTVDFGHLPVQNDQCLACHERPNDTHPIFRFLEPRFAEARQTIAPQNCVSCHREHNGVRVTAEPSFCSSCHQELRLRKDPLSITHEQLVKDEKWQTCLGCHDYHGNHPMNAPTSLRDTIPIARILDYMDGGRSPYPGPVRHKAEYVEGRRE